METKYGQLSLAPAGDEGIVLAVEHSVHRQDSSAMARYRRAANHRCSSTISPEKGPPQRRQGGLHSRVVL